MSYPGGYPGGQAMQGYAGSGYPGAQQTGGYPSGSYPASGGYAGQPSGYPGSRPGSGYQNQQGGYPGSGYPGGQAQQPSGYPGGGYPQGPPGINPEIQQWFNAVDRDRSGKITAKELQAALINGQGKNFSDTACNLMIGMFDQDRSGTIDLNEFQLLYNYINQWLATFRTYDRDNSGRIEEPELTLALQQMGFRFSPEFVKFLIARSDMEMHKHITVDQFIVLCVQVQRFTEAFRTRDKEMKGIITIGFEEFLSVALSCSV